MFKLVISITIFAVCVARPSLIASAPYVSHSAPFATIAYHQPTLATVGAVVSTVPTTVSHASHAVVHKSNQVVQDVVAPVVKTTYTPSVSYSTYSIAPVGYNSYAAAYPYAYDVARSW